MSSFQDTYHYNFQIEDMFCFSTNQFTYSIFELLSP